VKEGNIIKGLDDIRLHLVDRCRAPHHTVTELCCSPVLLNKVELAVVLRVEVAQVAARLNQLLKLGLLRDKIGLQKKDATAAAVRAVWGALKVVALGQKVSYSLGPQTALSDDDFHALEPAGHGVAIREIKRLRVAVWEYAAAHLWATSGPIFLRSCEKG
jgi:hypothetical protein